jgi:hypothetical protein
LLFLAALAALCAVLYFTDTSAGESAKPKVTHLGLTAKQWHARAVWRTKQRNRSRLSESRLRLLLRHEIQVKGTHPLERAFLCIHGGEGSWTSNTGNGYYGGMQMDLGFQRTYGSEYLRAWGTADNWPVSVQLAVSMKAYLSGRGFYPWPNTARACGLIG